MISNSVEDGEVKDDTARAINICENSVKMSQDSKKFLNVGDPTKTSLESGLNMPMVSDWACPEQLRPGLGHNELMVLVWNKPEQPILKQLPIVTDLSFLAGIKMVADNSMFNPIQLRTFV